MANLFAPIPQDDAIAAQQGKAGRLLATTSWINWFLALVTRVLQTMQGLPGLSRTNQLAAIATTPIVTGVLGAGLYLVSVYVRVTTPATTSSAVQATIGWTDGASTCTKAGSSVTGNLPSSTDTFTALVRVDRATSITIATTYGSVGATPMAYAIDVTVQAMPAV